MTIIIVDCWVTDPQLDSYIDATDTKLAFRAIRIRNDEIGRANREMTADVTTGLRHCMDDDDEKCVVINSVIMRLASYSNS